MKNIFFLSALMSLTIFMSCSNQELANEESTVYQEDIKNLGNASFTVDHIDNTLSERDDLLLSNNSENAVSYHWDFGNGDTSTEANPIFEYNIHGYYTVTLTITDIHGDTHQASHEILVLCRFGKEVPHN